MWIAKQNYFSNNAITASLLFVVCSVENIQKDHEAVDKTSCLFLGA